MERLSKFEKIKNREINISNEFYKICSIFDNNQLNLEYDFNDNFKKSPLSAYYVDFAELYNELIQDHSLEGFLDFSEIIHYLYLYGDFSYRSSKDADQLDCIIKTDLERLGYELVMLDDGTYKARIKDATVESIASSLKPSIQDKIYAYMMIRDGNVEEKRVCIKDLADDFETIRPKIGTRDPFKKLGQFIQCVRHTKDKPKPEFPFYYKNEEKWLDKIFRMLVASFAYSEANEICDEIIEEENKK